MLLQVLTHKNSSDKLRAIARRNAPFARFPLSLTHFPKDPHVFKTLGMVRVTMGTRRRGSKALRRKLCNYYMWTANRNRESNNYSDRLKAMRLNLSA